MTPSSSSSTAEAGLETDPRYHAWAVSQGSTLVFVIGALILTLNPIFHVLLRALPEIPDEPFVWRAVPMGVAVVAMGAISTSERARANAPVIAAGVYTCQLVSTGFQVVESGNHGTYAGAAMLPYITSQLGYVAVRHLLVGLGVGLGCTLTYSILTGHMAVPQDVYAQALLVAGATIAALLGTLRIRTMERELQGRLTLADQQAALERAEADARRAASEALVANQAKSAFLANMSHELRTPLNAIIGYSEMIGEVAEDDGFPHVIPDLDRIRSSAQHLLALIDDVLDLSKIEAGRMDVVCAPFRIADLLGELDAIGSVLAEKRGNRFEIRHGFVDEEVETDRTRTLQILSNLVSNACKFTTDGEVVVSAELIGPTLRCVVSDTGTGMDESQVSRLFQAFVQVHDASRREDVGGTGLGLALCRRFARLMGGEVTLRSAPGEGTHVTLELPRKPASLTT